MAVRDTDCNTWKDQALVTLVSWPGRCSLTKLDVCARSVRRTAALTGGRPNGLQGAKVKYLSAGAPPRLFMRLLEG